MQSLACRLYRRARYLALPVEDRLPNAEFGWHYYRAVNVLATAKANPAPDASKKQLRLPTILACGFVYSRYRDKLTRHLLHRFRYTLAGSLNPPVSANAQQHLLHSYLLLVSMPLGPPIHTPWRKHPGSARLLLVLIAHLCGAVLICELHFSGWPPLAHFRQGTCSTIHMSGPEVDGLVAGTGTHQHQKAMHTRCVMASSYDMRAGQQAKDFMPCPHACHPHNLYDHMQVPIHIALASSSVSGSLPARLLVPAVALWLSGATCSLTDAPTCATFSCTCSSAPTSAWR